MEEATEALLRSRASPLERYHYYQRLQGLASDSNVAPDTFPLDRQELTEGNFDEAYGTLVGQYDKTVAVQTYPQLKLAGDSSPANQSRAAGNGNLHLTTNENAELNTHLPNARDTRLAASVDDTLASVLALLPDLTIDMHFWGLGVSSKIGGGGQLSDVSADLADIIRTIAGWEQDMASMAAHAAGYERRADEWMLQSNLAARELMQIGRQILSSLQRRTC